MERAALLLKLAEFFERSSEDREDPKAKDDKSGLAERLRGKRAKDKGEKKDEGKDKKLESGDLKGGKDEPASKDKPGEGGRFAALKDRLRKQKGVKDPGALAAVIGRAKFGKGRLQAMAAKGRKG
ncbi:MAG: hypothetical protein ABFE07_29195 [Armatimonadia bacterium]